MEFDLSKRHCFYFNAISAIPRGSKNESGIADYLVNFAQEQGLEYKRDELHNVIIYREASKGRENDPGIILQAHIDMVCEKNNDVDFDFEKDSLKLKVTDGWLEAEGTTLGADDGFGVAYMLALLEDKELKSPLLECIFTVQEEIGLIGARNIKAEDLRAKRYVNLDGGGEVTTTVSCSGGRRVVARFDRSILKGDLPAYRLFIGGLSGGHSGGCIHLNRGNANVILALVLKSLAERFKDLELSVIEGGLKENAIAREASAVFLSRGENIEAAVAEIMAEVKEKFTESDNGLFYRLEECAAEQAILDGMSIVDFMALSPNGFMAPSMAIKGLTLASLNMGVVRTFSDRVEVYYQLRSPVKGYLEEMTLKLRTLAGLTHGSIEVGAEYPGWMFEKESVLRKQLRAILLKRGVELEEKATHGGLECGYFKMLDKEMDIITYGPIALNAHTPDEKMDLASFDRCYDTLKELIEL